MALSERELARIRRQAQAELDRRRAKELSPVKAAPAKRGKTTPSIGSRSQGRTMVTADEIQVGDTISDPHEHKKLKQPRKVVSIYTHPNVPDLRYMDLQEKSGRIKRRNQFFFDRKLWRHDAGLDIEGEAYE